MDAKQLYYINGRILIFYYLLKKRNYIIIYIKYK